MAEHEESHGHSVAAWTLVGLCLLGSAVVCLAVVLASIPVALIGIVVCVIGVVAGKVLAMAGFGQSKSSRSGTGAAAR